MFRRSFKMLLSVMLLPVLASVALASSGGGHGSGDGKHLWDEVNPAAGFDHLWHEVLVDITIIGVIFALVTIYLLIKYRRKHAGQEGRPPKLTAMAAAGWALIPIFIFMADDFFIAAEGWTLWNKYRNVPEEHYEIKLESAMWSWNFEYPGGVKTVNTLRVPAGTPIVMRMTSRDVVHSMFLPDFRVKEDSMPGRITYLWFIPEKPGEHLITCAEYCGILHSNMQGKVIAMEESEFNAWLEKEQAKVRAKEQAKIKAKGGGKR